MPSANVPAREKMCIVGRSTARTAMQTQTMGPWSGSVTARQLSLKTTPVTTAKWTLGLNVGTERCVARMSVWIYRQLTKTQTVQQNAPAMLSAITEVSVSVSLVGFLLPAIHRMKLSVLFLLEGLLPSQGQCWCFWVSLLVFWGSFGKNDRVPSCQLHAPKGISQQQKTLLTALTKLQFPANPCQ